MESESSGASLARGDTSVVARVPKATARLDWLFATTAALALLTAAGWLRTLAVPYVLACASATAIVAIIAALPVRGGGSRRRWRPTRLALAFIASAFCINAGLGQRALARVDHEWPAVEREAIARGQQRLARALETTGEALSGAAKRALDAPAAADSAFVHVEEVRETTGAMPAADWSLVLYRGGAPMAWSGTMRGAPSLPRAPMAVTPSAFYLVLQAMASRGDTMAVASVVVHADPPADKLTQALDEGIVAEAGLRHFEFVEPTAATDGGVRYAPGGVPLLTVRAVPLGQGAVRLAIAEAARVRGGLLAALLLGAFLAALWPRPATLAGRLASLVVALAAVALTPLSSYSNTTPLFDPLYYFAALGGPFTANAGALGLTSALVLLGLFAVLRGRVRVRSRALAAIIVLAVAALGPFLLRDLARGITPPRYGVTPALWLSWEITIFLAACAVLLAAASAGQAVLGERRGLSPIVAPALAGIAALLAQPLLDGAGRLPGWYAALWIAAMGTLALTRRTRAQLLTAATVAGLGASTLVWGSMARKRVDLARRDVAGLGAPDAYARALLERLIRDLDSDTGPATRAELLKRFTDSELAAAGYPVLLETRDDSVRVIAQLATAPGVGAGARGALDSAAAEARTLGEAIVIERAGAPTAQLVAAVPHLRGVTSIAVASRTRLLPDDPFAALYGLAAPQPAEAPYRLTIVPEARSATEAADGRWRREEDELHGSWTLGLAGGLTRAHAEVPLRSLDALVQRGVLVVLLDLAIVGLLWTASALADGGLPRWLRVRRAGTSRSYRARLTVALFAFFVIPAAAFAVWSYRRLQADDLQARVLVVGESLRGLSPADVERPEAASQRAQAPLFVFADGVLRAATDTLLVELAPLGRLAPAGVERALVLGDELLATRDEPLGPTGTLVAYRAVANGLGAPAIVAAPARASEDTLDRRRRDLGVLVLFATVLGALAALGLSGLAASELARPIGALREAALAIASGHSQPVPDEDPPSEFEPVFTAFRQMSSDLAQSRSALEEAQRRTAAVLRNVASGVVAVGPDGNVALANPRAEALLGRRLAAGMGLESLGAPLIEDRLRRFTVGSGDEEELDVELEKRQLRGRLTRLARGGAVLTLDDVTEVAHAQRVLAWGEMARQVAHEIKNPLTPIRLGVQMLRRAHADRRADFDRILDQNVGRILAEIDRLDEIARAFSRYGTAPQERPRAEVVDVAMIVRDVVALERMGEGSVDWRLDGADAPATALAREDELREVLLNLLENARLAGARVVTTRLALSDGRLRIAVSDDGGGIASAVLPRIFEPHFSTRTSGSGLGLAISRRMIEGWGGTITAASVVGEGTTMTVELVAAAE